MASKKT